jgi:hypothetical protein
MLWTYTLCVPFLINGLIKNTVARCAVCFMAVWSYHSLKTVGDNLEDPYTPYDPNELPLESIQDSINTRLLMFGKIPSEMSRQGTKDSQENGVPDTVVVPAAASTRAPEPQPAAVGSTEQDATKEEVAL